MGPPHPLGGAATDVAVKFFPLEGETSAIYIIWGIVPKEIRSHPRLVTIRVCLVAWGSLRASRDPVTLGASQLGAVPGILQVYSCEKPPFNPGDLFAPLC